MSDIYSMIRQIGLKAWENNGQRKPPLTPPRGENHWPARLIIDGLLYIMKITSQIIRQPGILMWDECKGLLNNEFETTTMPLSGFGNGPGEGVGAGFAGSISWPKVSRPPSSVRDVPFVSFCLQKERQEKQINFTDCINKSILSQLPMLVRDVPFGSF